MNSDGGKGRLQGRIALVTGAARERGMGYAVARLFAQQGAQVILSDVDSQVLTRAGGLCQEGYAAKGVVADLAQSDQVRQMVEQITNEFGTVEILCNVAGRSVPPRPSFVEMSEEYWDYVIAINLKTCFNCCKAVVPGMIAKRYGRIANWASVTGVRTVYRHSAAYAASKGAVRALTMALALELGEYGITANTILPGDIDTRSGRPWSLAEGRRDLGALAAHLSGPIPRPGTPEEVAELALFLCTEDARFITGTDIVIDGGLTIVEPLAAKIENIIMR